MRRFKAAVLVAAAGLAPCLGGSEPRAEDREIALAQPGPIEPTPQRAGDPVRGRAVLLDEPLLRCGPPRRMYEAVFGRAHDTELLPDRARVNRGLPYYVTSAEGERSIEVVAPNCLSCHAGFLDGELVIGLPNADLDQTFDVSSAAALGTFLVRSVDELVEWRRWTARLDATADSSRLDTRGLASADDLAVAIFAHRDPETLEWVDEPRFELPSEPVPLDTPAWFALEKKAALYYTGAGRGDHARMMMTSAAFCTDSVADAEEIDALMPDLVAYLHSLEAPPYPYAVDRRLASEGRRAFEEVCSECHGTYGREETYPNRLVGLSRIGTDPLLARSAVSGSAFVDSFNRSFYGRGSHLTPGEGYVAPALDGVWATAPYFHNGAVPTLEGVLDRRRRPTAWRRRDGFDRRAIGFRYETVPTGTGDSAIRDTTRRGQSSRGHAFGDLLSAGERAAVLEYLKTL
jgi:mono/diheme cytochrome c family protein